MLLPGEGIFDRAEGVASRRFIFVSDAIHVFADLVDPSLSDELLTDCWRNAGGLDRSRLGNRAWLGEQEGDERLLLWRTACESGEVNLPTGLGERQRDVFLCSKSLAYARRKDPVHHLRGGAAVVGRHPCGEGERIGGDQRIRVEHFENVSQLGPWKIDGSGMGADDAELGAAHERNPHE